MAPGVNRDLNGYSIKLHPLLTALNALAGASYQRIIDTLLDAAASTLTEFGANPQWLGGTLAFSLAK